MWIEIMRELLEVLSTLKFAKLCWWKQVEGTMGLIMDYKFRSRRIYDELQQQRDIHLLKLFMRHNQFVRGHQLKVMDEMFSMFDTEFKVFF